MRDDRVARLDEGAILGIKEFIHFRSRQRIPLSRAA